MRVVFLMTIICACFSCNINKSFTTLKYPINNEGHKLIIKIPKGYSFTHVGWESLYDGFQYSDSSVIYITDQYEAGINDNNIKDAGWKDKLFNAKMEKDTITFSGIDKKGLYWRYSVLGLYSIGYKNVKKERKEEFDRIMSTTSVR